MFLFYLLLSITYNPGNLGKPYMIPEGEEQVQKGGIMLESLPEVELKSTEKTALLRINTRKKVPPASVYFGLYRSELVKYPQFRRLSRAENDSFSVYHSVELPLDIFEHPRYDVTNFSSEGGVIYYRISIYDPQYGVSNFYDGRFRVNSKYEKIPCIVYGPFVDLLTGKSAVISLETDIPSNAVIKINDKEFTDSRRTAEHEIKISELEKGTEYSYAVLIDDRKSAEYKFRTEPESGSNFSFSVMSDSRAAAGGGERYFGESCNYHALTRLLLNAYNRGSNFVIFAGDLVNGYVSGKFDFVYQLKKWKNATEGIGSFIPIYEGMGNHEALVEKYESAEFDRRSPESAEDIFAEEFINPENGPEPESSLEALAPPYSENVYFFDYGNSRFISFNTNYAYCNKPEEYGGNLEGYVMDEQIKWIKNTIRDADMKEDIEHIFLYGHEPSFPNGGHLRDCQWYGGEKSYVIDRRDELWKIISNSSKVVAVFYGDEHNYSRMLVNEDTEFYEDNGYVPDEPLNPENPVWQIISGGAGAPFYGREHAPRGLSVRSFYPGVHYCFVEINGERVQLRVYDVMGQVVDECVLNR